ncbi:Mitogen-activated protein kinase 15 [Nymphon striatum]|nr:Mitogen-activated protein kinase 15 [Nymphon striatum]
MDPDISAKYEVKKEIGRGVFGIVVSAKSKQNQTNVAIKKLLTPFSSRIDAQRTYREILYLQLFKEHPNVIRLLDVEKGSSEMNLYLIFELMATDLQNAIKNNSFKEFHQVYVMYQIFRALNYLHSIRIAHRDLKPSNVLLDENCNVKVADFGLARVTLPSRNLSEYVAGLKLENDLIPMTEYIATRWYRAPELLVSINIYTVGKKC